MNAITLLIRSKGVDFMPEEEDLLSRELSAAYHMDEASATSREDQPRCPAHRGKCPRPDG